MKASAPALAAFLAALGGCNVNQPPKAEAEKVWVQLPVVPGRPGAAYFTLSSNNDPSKLLRVTSPRVERIELHETKTDNGVTTMAMVDGIVFPDGQTLVAEPGDGLHAMLFGIDPSVKPGDRIPLVFDLEPVPDVTVEAEVRAIGSGSRDH